MKKTCIFLFIIWSFKVTGQAWIPNSIVVSYLGETITHPGISVAANYPLTTWDKSQPTKDGHAKDKSSVIGLSPTLGLYYHRNYQTGIAIIPEVYYLRTKNERSQWGMHLGAGSLTAIAPAVYELGDNDQITKVNAVHQQWVLVLGMTFGRRLDKYGHKFLQLRPQWWSARPNFAGSINYAMLEIGVQIKLKPQKTN